MAPHCQHFVLVRSSRSARWKASRLPLRLEICCFKEVIIFRTCISSALCAGLKCFSVMMSHCVSANSAQPLLGEMGTQRSSSKAVELELRCTCSSICLDNMACKDSDLQDARRATSGSGMARFRSPGCGQQHLGSLWRGREQSRKLQIEFQCFCHRSSAKSSEASPRSCHRQVYEAPRFCAPHGCIFSRIRAPRYLSSNFLANCS